MVGKRKSQQGAHLAKQNSERASGKRVAPANYSDGDDDRDYELGDVQDDGSSDAASDDQLLDRNELKAKHNASQLDPAAERRRAQYRDSKRRSRNQSAQQAHAPTPLTGLRAFFGTPSAVATREGPTPGTITVDRRDASSRPTARRLVPPSVPKTSSAPPPPTLPLVHILPPMILVSAQSAWTPFRETRQEIGRA